MFGILYALFNGTMIGIAKTKESIDNDNKRFQAKEHGDLTYYGKNGERLVSNNRCVYRKTNNDGDKVLVDLYNGQVYKNYSAEERVKKEDKALRKGSTVLPVDYDENQKFNKKCRYETKVFSLNADYKDIETGRYYILAHINGIAFYMDIVTGLLVRPWDDADLSKKWGLLSVEEIMNIFNERQKEFYEIPKEQHDFMWWEKHFYLKRNGIYEIYMIDDDETIIYGKVKNEKIRKIRRKLIDEGGNNE